MRWKVNNGKLMLHSAYLSLDKFPRFKNTPSDDLWIFCLFWLNLNLVQICIQAFKNKFILRLVWIMMVFNNQFPNCNTFKSVDPTMCIIANCTPATCIKKNWEVNDFSLFFVVDCLAPTSFTRQYEYLHHYVKVEL